MGLQIAHGILYKIDSILFAEDYNALTGATKTRWIKERYFDQIHTPPFDNDDPYQVKVNWLENEKYKIPFNKWRKKFQHLTTARNRLFALYKFVSAPVYRINNLY